MATVSGSSYSIAKGSECEIPVDFYCSTCEDHSKKIDADFYCEICLKFFCRTCNQLHGQLHVKHTALGRKDKNRWPVSKNVEEFLLDCEDHKEKKAEMYCPEHSKLCCANCVLLNHRTCRKVALISEICTKESTDLEKLVEKIQRILNELKKLKQTWKTCIQSLQSSYDAQLQVLQETRRAINDELDKIEKFTIKEMTEKLATLQDSLWNDITTSKTLKGEIKRLGNAIHDIFYKGNEEFNFIAEKKCLKKIQISEEYIESNSEKAVCSLIFKADNDIQKLLSQFPRLGWIECSNWGLTVKKTSEYNMLTADDSTCTIKALCVRHDGMIIVADQANKKIKLLNQQYRIITHCDVSAEPQDVCEISFGEIAVAVDGWFTKEIQFIFELNGQLVNGRKLELQHPCYGISYHDGKLYITSSTALYKYSLCGKQESKIFEDTSAKKTVWKCAVSPTGTRVYITNQSQNKLLTVGMDGSVLASFTHPELRLPYGVHVTPAGKVLVCGNESTTVIQVDSGGKMKLATLASKWDGIKFPCSVFYNRNTASIIVGHFGNEILVFRLV